ncbi:MAG: rod shape-determining protein MreC [Candidatus Paceibacterota bacterium]
MNYRLRNKNDYERNGGSKIWAFCGFVAAVIILVFIFRLPFFENSFQFMAVPLWKTENYLSDQFGVMMVAFDSKAALKAENARLYQALQEATVASSSIDAYVKENNDLRAALGRQTNPVSKILATVLVKPPKSLYDNLIIDIGQSSGLKVGDKVFFQDLALGTVSEVYKNSSKVQLFSSPGQKIVIAIGDKNIHTDAFGRGGGNFAAVLPKEIAVKKGDSVIAPDISPKIFGTIQEVRSEPADAMQTVLFKTPINVAELQWVEVVKNEN